MSPDEMAELRRKVEVGQEYQELIICECERARRTGVVPERYEGRKCVCRVYKKGIPVKDINVKEIRFEG